MNNLEQIYNVKCSTPSDINEHLPTLRAYSEMCEHVTEFGVREPVSTYGLMFGKPKIMVSYDITPVEKFGVSRDYLKSIAYENGVNYSFIEGDTLSIDIDPTDLLFIDTLHVYGQLKAELWAHQGRIRRFIVLHDTEIDGDRGEILRMGWDARKMAEDTGMKEEELLQGMGRAIREFLAKFPEWVQQSHFANNNGLTVLARVQK